MTFRLNYFQRASSQICRWMFLRCSLRFYVIRGFPFTGCKQEYNASWFFNKKASIAVALLVFMWILQQQKNFRGIRLRLHFYIFWYKCKRLSKLFQILKCMKCYKIWVLIELSWNKVYNSFFLTFSNISFTWNISLK